MFERTAQATRRYAINRIAKFQTECRRAAARLHDHRISARRMLGAAASISHAGTVDGPERRRRPNARSRSCCDGVLSNAQKMTCSMPERRGRVGVCGAALRIARCRLPARLQRSLNHLDRGAARGRTLHCARSPSAHRRARSGGSLGTSMHPMPRSDSDLGRSVSNAHGRAASSLLEAPPTATRQLFFATVRFMWMFFSCVNASSSSMHSSRPMPDCL